MPSRVLSSTIEAPDTLAVGNIFTSGSGGATNTHPDIALAWGRVDVKTYTHKIDGLTESDFILAAKVDQEFFNRPMAG